MTMVMGAPDPIDRTACNHRAVIRMTALPPLSHRPSLPQNPASRLDGSAIRHLPFFAELDSAACDDIARMARVERVLAGETLFRQGDLPKNVFMVLSGEFKATQVTPEGDRVVVRLVGPGDLAGHVSMFCNTPYPATPIAMTESIALAWTPQDFASLMARHPDMSLAVIRSMARTIENAHTRLREAATERVERRIAHALLRLIKQAGHRTESGIEISFPITRHDIALMTGATLFTVSRTLSAWEQRGIVNGGRRHLIIRAPHALMRIAEEETTAK